MCACVCTRSHVALAVQMMEMAAANMLQQVEAALDDELGKIEKLDEDDYSKIRSNRIAEMKRKAEAEQQNKYNGHGKLDKISDQQEFFAAGKKSAKLVAIFTRNSNKYGKAMLEHAELLAQRHLEAKFIWIDAENAPFLTDRLNIFMLPTIVCIKDNKVHKQHNGLNEIDGSGKYSSGMLEFLLHADDMLDDAPLYDAEIREEEEVRRVATPHAPARCQSAPSRLLTRNPPFSTSVARAGIGGSRRLDGLYRRRDCVRSLFYYVFVLIEERACLQRI